MKYLVKDQTIETLFDIGDNIKIKNTNIVGHIQQIKFYDVNNLMGYIYLISTGWGLVEIQKEKIELQ